MIISSRKPKSVHTSEIVCCRFGFHMCPVAGLYFLTHSEKFLITGGEAYLDALADALSGKLRLRWDAPRTAPGVWSASPLPPSVQVVPPCYIGPGVQVGEGSLLGPHTVLEGGSTVGRRALVQRSALLGAAAEERTTLYGAVLCPGAAARAGAVLNESTTYLE